MRTILLTAYAINPYKGSEDGTAWNMVAQLMKYHNIIVITRENNEEHIHKYISENKPEGYLNAHFEYFDLPYWMRFWKKGGRGALLYFYMWQFGIVRFIKKRKLQFDIAHNLNFHSSWTPSFLWRLKKPFVWGPIGHHPKIPKGYLLPFYGKRQHQIDLLKWWTKQFFWKIDPFLKITKKRAAIIIGINSSIAKVLKVSPDKVAIIPAVGSEPTGFTDVPKSNDTFEVLSIGRFVPLKGFDMTIKAFIEFFKKLNPEERKQVKLTLVGKGPYREQLEKLIYKENIVGGIEIIKWIEREKLKDIYKKADVFLFPSHEGAGMVVPEALSYGVPVLCYDNIGPGEFIDTSCGIAIPYSTYDQSIYDFANHLFDLFKNQNKLGELQVGALKQYNEKFDWKIKGKQLSELYKSL